MLLKCYIWKGLEIVQNAQMNSSSLELMAPLRRTNVKELKIRRVHKVKICKHWFMVCALWFFQLGIKCVQTIAKVRQGEKYWKFSVGRIEEMNNGEILP